jgi:hypothetical protein
MEQKFSLNNFGIKILHENSKSYQTFSTESTSLEFLLIYILLAEQNNKKDKKEYLKNLFLKKDLSKLDIALNEFLDSEQSDIIFSIDTYENYFGQMAYTRIADNALCYFKDIIAEVVTKRPEILKSKEKETLEFIFSFDNMDSLINAISEKKVNELFYGGVEDIKNYFNTRLGIKMFQNETEEKNFNQFIKQRNLIVHNRGIISKEFSKEFSTDKIIYEVGNKLLFNYANLSLINGVIINLIAELDLLICEKFKLETIKVI